MSQDPLVYIIDIGGSYRKLCEYLGGQYIEITPPQNDEEVVPINPFQLPQGTRSPSPQKIKFLLAFLESILTDEGDGRLTKLEKSLLEEAVITTYRESAGNQSPTLSRLVAVMQRSPEASLRALSRSLFPWTGDRPYGRLLDAQNALDVENRFVVFDLKGLANYPDLQSVMLLIITDFILGQVERRNAPGKQILMDECWDLLKRRTSVQFMEHCVRTLRKSGSGITFITQGLEEIIASPIGPAILSNTATKLVLMQRGDLGPVASTLRLNSQEMSLISSLRQSKGRYSEAFLIANEARSVVRACPTPLEYWIATSDAADNRLLDERRRESPGKPLREILIALSSEYPHGASGGQI